MNSAPQEKERIKKEKDVSEAKYKVAFVDGREEPVSACTSMLQSHVCTPSMWHQHASHHVLTPKDTTSKCRA